MIGATSILNAELVTVTYAKTLKKPGAISK
jgi:hypothetical protein